MSNKIQWCVAAVPTPAWAAQVYPNLPAEEAMDRLWQTLLQVCRVDRPDPVAAWREHDANLGKVPDYLARNKVRAVHFVDDEPGPDGAHIRPQARRRNHSPSFRAISSANQTGRFHNGSTSTVRMPVPLKLSSAVSSPISSGAR